MRVADARWFVNAYDQVVRDCDDELGLQPKESSMRVIEMYDEHVRSGLIQPFELSHEQIASMMFEQHVRPERRRRRSVLRDELERMVELLRSHEHYTVLEGEDPRFDQAFPIGNGFDKTFLDWSVNDLRVSTDVREIKASEATIAATAYGEVVEELVDEMRERNANTLSEALKADHFVAASM